MSKIQNVYTNQTVHRTPITYVGDELLKHETHLSKGVPDLSTSIQSLFYEVMKEPYDQHEEVKGSSSFRNNDADDSEDDSVTVTDSAMSSLS